METVQTKRGIDGGALKIIAVITMTIDHIGAVLLARFLVAGACEGGVLELLVVEMGLPTWSYQTLYHVYVVTRYIGRISFPIYCFLLVEGFLRTKDVKKYALRLGMFALVSEVPFDLAFNARVLEFGYQNVFFTLFLGLLVMMALERVQNREMVPFLKMSLCTAVVLAGCLLAELLKTDYAAYGVLSISALYLFCSNRSWQIVAGCITFLWEPLTALLGFIPISFYNGRRGIRQKYFFYVFYPAHLLLIYLVAMCFGLAGYAVVQ